MKSAILLVSLAGSAGSAGSPGGRLGDQLHDFTPEEVARGRARARAARGAWAVGGILGAAALGLLWVLKAHRLVPYSGSLGLLLCSGLTALAYLLARTPASYLGFLVERSYGLARLGYPGFTWRLFKSGAVEWVLITGGVFLILFVFRRFGGRFGSVKAALLAWAGLSLAAATYVLLSPVLIDPLFGRFEPVWDTELRTRIEKVASRAGIRLKEALWLDAGKRTRRANAYFTGLGPTKRVVLYDTLKEEMSVEEIEAVVAHEAGHWMKGHVWKGLLLGLLGAGLGLLALAFLPQLVTGKEAAPKVLLFALAASILAQPVFCAVSRVLERQADRAALRLGAEPEACVGTLLKLARRNIAELDPSPAAVFFFYTHPPILERIEAARSFRRAGGG